MVKENKSLHHAGRTALGRCYSPGFTLTFFSFSFVTPKSPSGSLLKIDYFVACLFALAVTLPSFCLRHPYPLETSSHSCHDRLCFASVLVVVCRQYIRVAVVVYPAHRRYRRCKSFSYFSCSPFGCRATSSCDRRKFVRNSFLRTGQCGLFR